MKQAAKSARKFHDMAAASFAAARATPTIEPIEPARAVPLDLKSLIAPYRSHSHLSLRVENLPQAARLSAGQNNGDRTWSLMLHELEDLVYFPPKAAKAEQVLALRLIAKDEAEAYTIALIDLPVAEAGALAPPVHHMAAKPVSFARDAASQEMKELKAALAGREAELSASRAAAGRMDIHWQGKLKTALADAEMVWRKEESLRLEMIQLEIEEKWARRTENMRAEAEAALREAQSLWKKDETLRLEAVKRELEEARKLAIPRPPAAEHDLSLLRQDLVAAKDALVAGKVEQARLQAELERQKRQAEADIAQVKALAETARAAALNSTEANLTAQADKRQGALKARAEAAEAALASAEMAAQTRQSEVAGLQAELEQQRQAAQMVQARAEAVAARPSHDDAYVRGLEREIKSLRASLVDREADIAHSEVMKDIRTPRPSSARWRSQANRPERPDESQSHLFRDILIVIVGGAAAVLLFPQIEARLPNNWRWQIETLGGFRDINEAQAPQPAPLPKPSPAPEPVPPPSASLLRAANLRQEPSVNAAIVASLKRGQQISILEKRGNWDRVQIAGESAQAGWVFGSYVAAGGN